MKRGVLLSICIALLFLVTYLNVYSGNAVACVDEGVVCGYDGVTYENSCDVSVKVLHSGSCVKDSFVVLYADPDTGILQFWNTFNPRHVQKLFHLDYGDTNNDNVVFNVQDFKDDLFTLRMNIKADQGFPLLNEDYFLLHWNISNGKMQGLGALPLNTNDTGLEGLFGFSQETELISLEPIEEDLRSRYGVVLLSPKTHALKDKVAFKIPNNQVKAVISIYDKGKSNTEQATLGIGDSFNAQYKQKEFSLLKDSTLSLSNSTYHFYEHVVVKDAFTPTTNMQSKDLRFGKQVYLELPSDALLYRHIFVNPLPLSTLSSGSGLGLSLLDKSMTVYAAEQSTGKLILDYSGSIKPYYTNDPFVTEVGNDTKWVWDIDIIPKMQLGVKNLKSYTTYDDKPITPGECYKLPFDFFSFCFTNLTVPDTSYLDLNLEVLKSLDFSVLYPSWKNVSALKISVHTLKSLKLDIADSSIGVHTLYLFPLPFLDEIQDEEDFEPVSSVVETSLTKESPVVLEKKLSFEFVQSFLQFFKHLQLKNVVTYLQYGFGFLIFFLLIEQMFRHFKK